MTDANGFDWLKLHAEIEASRPKLCCPTCFVDGAQYQHEKDRAEIEKLKSALDKIIFLGSKGTARMFPDQTLAECVKVAKEATRAVGGEG